MWRGTCHVAGCLRFEAQKLEIISNSRRCFVCERSGVGLERLDSDLARRWGVGLGNALVIKWNHASVHLLSAVLSFRLIATHWH